MAGFDTTGGGDAPVSRRRSTLKIAAGIAAALLAMFAIVATRAMLVPARPDASPSTVSETADVSPLADPFALIVEGSYLFTVQVDAGAPDAEASSHELRLPSGAKRVTLTSDRYFLHRIYDVIGVAGAEVRVSAPELGTLSIPATPAVSGCAVTLNGFAAGDVPLADVSIAAGDYEVLIRCADGNQYPQSIVIRPGELTEVRIPQG